MDLAAQLFPPLTTVRPDFEAVASASISLLLGQLETGRSTDERHTIAPRLVERASVAPPP